MLVNARLMPIVTSSSRCAEEHQDQGQNGENGAGRENGAVPERGHSAEADQQAGHDSTDTAGVLAVVQISPDCGPIACAGLSRSGFNDHGNVGVVVGVSVLVGVAAGVSVLVGVVDGSGVI
ncbi:hypothetical protein EV646_113101 [Kribbella antiqua]|uniref:Uncharacterized protein n=1 Tax=Kribbella antiqua TaxID=2512217 RepID=A0A4R2IF87_9ACTN|nr:hypothetical protein EV646_113101 [Kribbella antiqua]